ncbi:MAG: hypothetical protein HYV07_04190, partial [Deltaproteobacteria bacterium]|nr:hypothetical protein [Deltaproteobacteria bacterium]
MSDPTTQPTTEVALDPELARNAYERFVGAARDLSPSEVRPVTADHAAVARVAHAAAGELAKAGVAVRFEGLEKEKYLDPRHRQDLSELALALFHAATLEAAAGVGESTALVPGDRVRLANETKARMSKVLEYFFAEDE